jgi:hypothetical protein
MIPRGPLGRLVASKWWKVCNDANDYLKKLILHIFFFKFHIIFTTNLSFQSREALLHTNYLSICLVIVHSSSFSDDMLHVTFLAFDQGN